ncbi:hypothetical protein AAG570_005383 [Ranatra chinensis]|uniref:Uncharacterized protein n=1 Tax=Ranatra chinensis TaxID=642074 RepID=A0ABD0YII8_9HEMI
MRGSSGQTTVILPPTQTIVGRTLKKKFQLCPLNPPRRLKRRWPRDNDPTVDHNEPVPTTGGLKESWPRDSLPRRSPCYHASHQPGLHYTIMEYAPLHRSKPLPHYLLLPLSVGKTFPTQESFSFHKLSADSRRKVRGLKTERFSRRRIVGANCWRLAEWAGGEMGVRDWRLEWLKRRIQRLFTLDSDVLVKELLGSEGGRVKARMKNFLRENPSSYHDYESMIFSVYKVMHEELEYEEIIVTEEGNLFRKLFPSCLAIGPIWVSGSANQEYHKRHRSEVYMPPVAGFGEERMTPQGQPGGEQGWLSIGV